MKAIDKIIFNELASRRAVVLPGLGTLGVVRRPAQITGKEVKPPVNQVVYSREEAQDASSVITLMESMGVARSDAESAYAEWSDGVHDGDEIVLEGVGRVSQGAFTPSAELAQMLNPVRSQSEGEGSAAPQASTASRDERKLSCLAKILLAAAILLLLIIGCICYCHWGDICGKGCCGRAKAAPTGIVAAAAENANAGESATDTLQVEIPQPMAQPAVQGSKLFHLIAGSFVYESNADEMAERYRRQFPDLTIEQIKTPAWIMVSVYQGSSAEDAEAANRRLSGQLNNLEMWVYKKK